MEQAFLMEEIEKTVSTGFGWYRIECPKTQERLDDVYAAGPEQAAEIFKAKSPGVEFLVV